MIKPLNNSCLVEIIDDNEGLYAGNNDENVQKGVLLEGGLNRYHLTASTGFDLGGTEDISELMDHLQGKTVYWQEYADVGSKFEQDGKKYALVPWYRLIGYDE